MIVYILVYTLHGLEEPMTEELNQFYSRTIKINECLEWIATGKTYLRPIFVYKNKKVSAKKYIWEHFNGKIERGFVENICDNRLCVNHKHLQLIIGKSYKPITSKDRELDFYKNTKQVDDCMIWTKSLDVDRYGIYSYIENGVRKTHRAHRFSYELNYGPISPGKMIRHLCNNRSCINPKHLIEGTHAENMKDVALSDIQKGSNHSKAKLNEKQVLKIKKMLIENRLSYAEIAKQFSVSKETISAIKNNRSWQWLTI